MYPFDNKEEFENPPRTFEELDEWAIRTSNPIVHNAISSFRAGHRTKEEALLLAVYYLAQQNAEQFALLYEKAMHESPTMIVPVADMLGR
jgi:hypothetical protein